jgi:pimeloyl-ACP methyl ester carboxylesterase
MAGWTRRQVIASALALAGCATLDPQPALHKVYGGVRPGESQPPLVFIPGAFGSTLRVRHGGREVWPASDSQLLFGNYRGLELPIDPVTLQPLDDGVEAYAVFREGLGRDFYGRAIEALQRIGGYRLCMPGSKPSATDCGLYPYLYDFRLDNVTAAAGLEALIQRIKRDHGDPGLRVDVVAHSNGGLLARYYARYGAAALPDEGPFVPDGAGARNIRRLLLVGTPNLGTAQPILSLLRGEEVGLRRIPPEVMATCPGAMQLMPHPRVPWLADIKGRPVEADLYDIRTWRDFGWNVFDPRVAERVRARHGGGAEGTRYLAVLREYLAKHLQRGRRFAEALTAEPGSGEPGVTVFGADCELTLSRLVLERVGDVAYARERVSDILSPGNVDYEAVMFEPGDTVVTRSSLLGWTPARFTAPRDPYGSLSVAHVHLFCERHQQLTGNATLLDNLLHALLVSPT